MALESSHWYTRAGEPFYEILNKNGVLRATTLADARKIGAVPSVTTVLKIIDKPQLVKWRVKQAVMAALTMPRREGEPEEIYLERIVEDSEEQVVVAADEGTRVHDVLEKSFKGGDILVADMPHVHAVHARLAEMFPGVSDWVSERSFCHPLGYGGKVDLHSPSTGIVVDFKGKDGDFSDKKKLAYDQNWQLAGYRRGLDLPPAPGGNIFFSRTHPGKAEGHVWTADEMNYGEDVFLAALALWKILKKYDPSGSSQWK